jgi:proteasome beta subunit
MIIVSGEALVKLLKERPEVKRTGTTTVGIICKDCVVLAAEKKSTMGYLVASKESEKIIPIADHIALTIAGVSGDAQTLARYMQAELKLLQGSKYLPYFVQLIVAGYDDAPRIYDLDAIGGVEEEKKFFSSGSGSPIALGVLEDNFKEGMSAEEGIELAVRAIKAAIERDIGSGGRAIDIAVISKEGIKISSRELSK